MITMFSLCPRGGFFTCIIAFILRIQTIRFHLIEKVKILLSLKVPSFKGTSNNFALVIEILVR